MQEMHTVCNHIRALAITRQQTETTLRRHVPHFFIGSGSGVRRLYTTTSASRTRRSEVGGHLIRLYLDDI